MTTTATTTTKETKPKWARNKSKNKQKSEDILWNGECFFCVRCLFAGVWLCMGFGCEQMKAQKLFIFKHSAVIFFLSVVFLPFLFISSGNNTHTHTVRVWGQSGYKLAWKTLKWILHTWHVVRVHNIYIFEFLLQVEKNKNQRHTQIFIVLSHKMWREGWWWWLWWWWRWQWYTSTKYTKYNSSSNNNNKTTQVLQDFYSRDYMSISITYLCSYDWWVTRCISNKNKNVDMSQHKSVCGLCVKCHNCTATLYLL